VLSGGIKEVNFLYQTEHGISVLSVTAYIIYYGIILSIIIPSLIGGKRTFCHYFCWMAPFTIIGSSLRKFLHIPGIGITANNSCISCKMCNTACPMSIDVEAELKRGLIQDTECIQCGACIDCCPKKVLRYKLTNVAVRKNGK
jgi:ferredoxin